MDILLISKYVRTKFCIVHISVSATYNTDILKTTLLQALQQTQSEIGMFHYIKYRSQRK